MALPYSARSRAIEPFHVMALLARANELQAAGHDVIHLEIGEPDFTTAEPIIKAGQAALSAGKTRYTAARGIPELRQAISGFYRQRYALDIDPERIMITPGGSGALLLASSLLVDPGKHWLLADPGYPCNRHFLRLVEGAAQLVPVGPDVRYQLTPDLVERYWDQDSVGALVASPANPTGTVLSRDELAGLSAAIKARNGHLVVDEIYHGLTYGIDAASVLEVDDSAFVLNSFSKYFGMTGWRLGWLVAPEGAVSELEKLAQNLYISAPSIAQYAALACFEPQTISVLEERRAEFARRRDFLLPALRELGFGIAVEPEGAFYLYADISAFGGDAFAFCRHFLETEHLAFTPGLDFGRHQAGHHVRFAYTQNLERLQQAVERIARGLQELARLMRFDPPLEEGRLLRRYKRFLADIETLDGELLTIHCPNTGSMLNCMVEGGQLWFSRSNDPKRKLPGTWEISETPQGRLACVNTGRANALVEEALRAGSIAELAGFTGLKREVPYGQENSRIDFRLEYPDGPAYVEVKSVTLGFDGSAVAAFPDAVTQRGAKHLRELAGLAREGVRAVQLYCVNLSGIEAVRPAEEIDPGYAAALREALAAGVEVLAYGVRLSAQEVCIERRLEVLLDAQRSTQIP